jgi:hypothetical protein
MILDVAGLVSRGVGTDVGCSHDFRFSNAKSTSLMTK